MLTSSVEAEGIFGICNRMQQQRHQQQDQQQQLQQQQTSVRPEDKLNFPMLKKVQWGVGDKNLIVKFRLPLEILCFKFHSVSKKMKHDLKGMLFHRKSNHL